MATPMELVDMDLILLQEKPLQLHVGCCRLVNLVMDLVMPLKPSQDSQQPIPSLLSKPLIMLLLELLASGLQDAWIRSWSGNKFRLKDRRTQGSPRVHEIRPFDRPHRKPPYQTYI